MNRLARDQIPFAMSQAINRTVFWLRGRGRSGPIQREWNRQIPEARRANFPNFDLRVRRATKNRLVGTVADQGRRREILDRQARRNVRRARGRFLTIPVGNVPRTATGRVRRGYLDSPRTFVIGSGSRRFIAYRRSKRAPLEIRGVLKPAAFVPQYYTNERLCVFAERRFDFEFPPALRQAVRTARLPRTATEGEQRLR